MTPDADASLLSGSSPDHRDAWEKVRRSFQGSIMMDTSLASLAQNLDVAEWPLSGADETPAKYVGLSYDELLEHRSFILHPDRVKLLVTILRDTLAFDEPFGDMVTETAEMAERDNPILRSLARLGIPENFPLSLVALLPETRDYCNLENLITLRDFALFAQNLSQTVIVSGDFRSFLNALSHVDEQALVAFMPYRPGSKGLHLLEGIALTVRAQSDEVQAALAKRFGARLGQSDLATASHASKLETAAIETILEQQTAAYVDYFQADLANLQKQIDDGVPLSRLASVLSNPILETVVTGLLKPYLRLLPSSAPTRTTAPPLEDGQEKRRGLFAKLGKLFKK